MPLSINVGLSRKASRDYQSTGVSINVTAEPRFGRFCKGLVELQQEIGRFQCPGRKAALDRQPIGKPPSPRDAHQCQCPPRCQQRPPQR